MADNWVSYFKNHPPYHKLFLAFKQKYQSLGKVGGSVSLNSFSHDEIETFALFLGAEPEDLMTKQKIFLRHFEEKLTGRKFPDITLHQLLEQYFECEIRGKKEVADELEIQMNEVINDYKRRYPELLQWLLYLENKTSDTLWIWSLIRKGLFEEELLILSRAFLSLPTEFERYPLFSQRITGNPHRFDLKTVTGRLFLHVLHVMNGATGPVSQKTEAINDLLLSSNLVRDDIHNFVTFANLLGFKNNQIHPVWQAALDAQSVLNMPLRELLKIDEIQLRTPEKKVFIVENSGVFSSLLDAVPEAPLICTHGQFKLAGLRLLDQLAAAGYIIYYSGDFDPEGISMALRLAQRYKDKCQLWRMDVANYHAASPTVKLGERERNLKGLKGRGLDELLSVIARTGKIGYQEGIIEKLREDLLKRLE